MIIWVSEIELEAIFKKNWNETLWDQIWPRENHQIPRHENISYHIKQTFFVLWTTTCWSCQTNTPKITCQIFTCITTNQTFFLKEPLRLYYPSTSKMVGCHLFQLLKITINKQELDGIKICQSAILQYILIFTPPRHPYKAIYNKRKLSIIIKSTFNSPLQGCSYSFIYSPKITRQTHHLNKSWQRILPSCCCCVLHDYSTWMT